VGSFCWNHAPEMAGARKERASKAGRSGGNGRPGGLSETAEAKRYIRAIIDRLLNGRIERGPATATFQGLNVLARFIDLETKIAEQEELRERIEHLENLERKPGGGRRWGA
jgi:hypothetical protein